MESGSPNAEWTDALAVAVSATVAHLASRLRGEPLAMLAVDCHPWHGTLSLSVLTASEVDADPMLADPAEMAAWRHFHSSDGKPGWDAVAELGQEMRAAYSASPVRCETATAYLKACAVAMASSGVLSAIEAFDRDPRFRISVAHPDDGREFYPPAG
jgi:hypothetical protein